MLVKVHSYYSTTFVPGHFTPDSWNIPLDGAFQGAEVVSVIDSSILSADLGIGSVTNLYQIGTAESNLDSKQLISAFILNTFNVADTDLSGASVLNGFLLAAIAVAETNVNSSNLLTHTSFYAADIGVQNFASSELLESFSSLAVTSVVANTVKVAINIPRAVSVMTTVEQTVKTGVNSASVGLTNIVSVLVKAQINGSRSNQTSIGVEIHSTPIIN